MEINEKLPQQERPLQEGDPVLVSWKGDIESGWTLKGFNPKTGVAFVEKTFASDPNLPLRTEVSRGEFWQLNTRQRTFQEWHGLWLGLGGDGRAMFGTEQMVDPTKISASKAWSRLKSARIKDFDKRDEMEQVFRFLAKPLE